MSDLCNDSYRFAGSSVVFKCRREEDHFGAHQVLTRDYYKDKSVLANATWNNGGAVCGAIDSMYWNECDECAILIADDKDICFSCANWQDLMKTKSATRIVIENHHYLIGSRGGFGGREFSIEFLDTARNPIVTDRLWSQGEVPVHFRDRIPDNARWKITKKPPASNFADFAQLLNP